MLENYVNVLKFYEENDQENTNAMIKQASEGMFAYIYLENSDHDNHGSIIHNLNSQKSLGNYQYPLTIVKTNNIFINNKFDINKNKKKYKKQPKVNKKKEDKYYKNSIPF